MIRKSKDGRFTIHKAGFEAKIVIYRLHLLSLQIWITNSQPHITLDLNLSNPQQIKKGKRKVQGVPQSQTAALPRPQEEEEADKSKQAQIGQTYEKHED